MKIAILADIHANWRALQAVADHIEQWQPDHVIVAGDVVNRGPRPRECLQFIQSKERASGWRCVIGNHEEYVISHARPGAARSGPRFEINHTSFWTYQQLDCDVTHLSDWPFQRSLWLEDGEVRFVHASMRGTRDGVHVETSDEDLRQKIAPSPRVLVVGHTHKPLVRPIDQTLVVNVGSVGLPFDGDPRAGYAQLTWRAGAWHADIMRLAYDREQADRDFDESGFSEQVGPMARLIRDELRRARSNLFEWSAQYEAAVLAGAVSIDASARRYLQANGAESAG
jgi:putative phosphoesterase